MKRAESVDTRTQVHVLAERLRDALRHRDAAALANCHHPDAVIDSPLFANARGHAAIEASYTSLFRAFPDLEFTVNTMLVDPPQIASYETMRGTHSNEFLGYRGTNKRFEISLARLMTVEHGQITRQLVIYDFTGLLVQLGVLSTKPGKR